LNWDEKTSEKRYEHQSTKHWEAKVNMSDRWAFSVNIAGPEFARQEFFRAIINGVVPERLIPLLAPDSGLYYEAMDSILNVLGDGQLYGWWEYSEHLEYISECFPLVTFELNRESHDSTYRNGRRRTLKPFESKNQPPRLSDEVEALLKNSGLSRSWLWWIESNRGFEKGSDNWLREIVESGYDLLSLDGGGDNCFFQQVRYNHDYANLLLVLDGLQDKLNWNRFANWLCLTHMRKHPEAINQLLELGMVPDQQDHDGDSLLMCAIRWAGDFDVLNLVRATVNINHRNATGKTAFLLACAYNRDTKILLALLEKGADPTVYDLRSRTALMLGAAAGVASETLTVLTKLGLSGQERDNLGATALRYVKVDDRGKPLRQLETLLKRLCGSNQLSDRTKELYWPLFHRGWSV